MTDEELNNLSNESQDVTEMNTQVSSYFDATAHHATAPQVKFRLIYSVENLEFDNFSDAMLAAGNDTTKISSKRIPLQTPEEIEMQQLQSQMQTLNTWRAIIEMMKL